MLRVVVLLTIAIAPLLRPASLHGQPARGAHEAALLALDSVWARNYATHDTTKAKALMADDLFVTSVNGSTKDRETELRDIRPAGGLTMEYFRTEQVRVRVYGSAGVVTGVAAWAFQMNGRASSFRRRYTATYVQGGPLGWQLVALHMGRAE